MARNVRPIYVNDILNLYDYNRDGQVPIYLVEDDDRSILLDSSCIAIDLMSDMQVDSIGIEDDGRLIIYLHDNAICEYWAKYKHRADKKIGDDE